MTKQLTLRVPDNLLHLIDSHKPDFLDRNSFLLLLISQTLDKGITLGVASGSEQLPSSSSSIITNKTISNNTNKKGSKSNSQSKAKHTKGTPEFEAFWSAYQGCDHKANGQSKAKAWEVYREVVKEVEPDRLLTAINNAIGDISRRTVSGEFASPLPDCFRWLRDEHYAVWLETHSTPSSNWTLL